MYKNYYLSKEHYAYKWKVPEDYEHNDRQEVNEIAIKCSNLDPDCDRLEKEELLLSLIKNFHGYLMKYTLMVVKGQIPSIKTPAGRDAAKMLKTLMPPGTSDSYIELSKACKTLHLAFKQLTIDEVYDVMVMCFLKAAKKYDPNYTKKIKEVHDFLEIEFTRKNIVKVDEVTEGVGFPSSRCLKWMSKKKYLVPSLNEKKKIYAYKRGPSWPIPKETFTKGPIGFTYFAQVWFRYYLNDYITTAMSELEARPDILQLGHTNVEGDSEIGNVGSAIPSLTGNYVDTYGTTWLADVELINTQHDVSKLTFDWVRHSQDALFKDLTFKQRWLLKMVYQDELSWSDIAKNLDCTVNTAKAQWRSTIIIIQSKL